MSHLDDVYTESVRWLERENRDKHALPRVRLWNSAWELIDELVGYKELEVNFVHNDAGTGYFDIGLDHYLADVLREIPWKQEKRGLFMTVDKDGTRWSGRMTEMQITWNAMGEQVIRCTFLHDLAKLKKLLAWANPWAPAFVQFPKAWTLIGPADWAVALTIEANVNRINGHLSLQKDSWVAMEPTSLFSGLPLAMISSRFKTVYDAISEILEDAQLTLSCRRYIAGEDPEPTLGLIHAPVRTGLLVFKVEDNSAWRKGTSWFGDIFNGLLFFVGAIGDNGLDETLEQVQNPNIPNQYRLPGWRGTIPTCPWVVLTDGKRTGVDATEYVWKSPGPYKFVVGGKSMIGVNELIKASIIGIGGLVGSIFGQSQLGAVLESVLEPLYKDVLLAFHSSTMTTRFNRDGPDMDWEMMCDGSDQAYSISALKAMRKAKFETSDTHSAKVTLKNGGPYRIGARGVGDFFVGDRVAVHAAGMPEGKLFVAQVTKATYKVSKDSREWTTEIGSGEPRDPVLYLAKRYDRLMEGLRNVGVM